MQNKDNILVGVVMGSNSDREIMQHCWKTLSELKISYEVIIASAHRTPEKVMQYAVSAKDRGIKVLIAGAGGAAHLAGVIAAWTPLPVIGVPLTSSEIKGIDALLSTAQMPPGIPVATVSLGTWGAKNAAIFAARILAASDDNIAKRFDEFHKRMKDKVLEYDIVAKESF